jgi:hypothetical protein
VVKTGVLLISPSGLTVPLLSEEGLELEIYLVARSDNDSKIASGLVSPYLRF